MVYLDYNATTPVLPEVFEVMKPFFCEHWANPSSPYLFAKESSDAIEEARQHVAQLIGAQPEEIFFTSCATESNQTILHGTAGKVATSAVEHSSILEFLKNRGDALFIPVNSEGLLDLERLDSDLSKGQVALASFIWANNETGVISPIQEIAAICDKHGVSLHSDAVQAAGKVVIDVAHTTVNYLSLNAHKIYGPKGVGAVYIRKGSPYKPLLIGSQERTRRGGTEAVPLIVGFGKAAEMARTDLDKRSHLSSQIRDKLEQAVLKNIPGAYINGSRDNRLPNTLNIGFPSIDSDMIVQLLGKRGIMVSNGSACKSQAITPSHVLIAMGKSHEAASEALRFSVSHLTKETEIDTAVSTLKELVESFSS